MRKTLPMVSHTMYPIVRITQVLRLRHSYASSGYKSCILYSISLSPGEPESIRRRIIRMRRIFRPQGCLQDRILDPSIRVFQHLRVHVTRVDSHLIPFSVSRGSSSRRLKRPPIASTHEQHHHGQHQFLGQILVTSKESKGDRLDR